MTQPGGRTGWRLDQWAERSVSGLLWAQDRNNGGDREELDRTGKTVGEEWILMSPKYFIRTAVGLGSGA